MSDLVKSPKKRSDGALSLSVVAPIYKSPNAIGELVSRTVKSCKKLVGDSFEIILIDDGCPFGSGEIARGFLSDYPQLRVISLSRNFGQNAATLFGLSKTRGQRIFLMDGDLDDDPEILEKFWEVMNSVQSECVFGYQARSRRGFIDKISGGLGYKLMNFLLDFKVTPNFVNARLMSRKFLDAVVEQEEKNPFLGIMWEQVGFEKVAVQVIKNTRSESTYTPRTKIKLFFEGISHSTEKPVQMIFTLGVVSALIGSLVVFLVLLRWSSGDTLAGWASVLGSIWIVSAAVLFSLGVVAHYVGVVIKKISSGPLVIVSEDSVGN